jgi:hypothetical protein
VCELGQTGSCLAALRTLRMSLEKPFPCWLDEGDGKLYLHHPKNATVTLLCTNIGIGRRGGAMIPWDKIALQLTEQTKDLKPSAGHDPSTQSEWEAFERATDNIYAIAEQVPFRTRTRTDPRNAYANQKNFKRLIQELKSGILDGQSSYGHGFKFRADCFSYRIRLKNPSTFTAWTEKEIQSLIDHLKFLETSQRFNPYGLRFVRNSDGSPWFWRLDHRPTNADWTMINRDFQARYWTMDETCDWKSETTESPCTIFLLYAIQWLRNGDKCHIFGYTMTWAIGHPCVFSIGRAVSVNDEGGTHIRDVQPGETMLTGFSSSFPTDIDLEYDFTRCTIIIESWRANSLRYNFLGGRELIDRLKQSVRNRALETVWYSAPQPKDAYRESPNIGEYHPSRFNRKRFSLRKRVSSVDSDDSDDAEVDTDLTEDEDEDLTEDEDEDDSFDIIDIEDEKEIEEDAVEEGLSEASKSGKDTGNVYLGGQSAQQSHSRQVHDRQGK